MINLVCNNGDRQYIRYFISHITNNNKKMEKSGFSQRSENFENVCEMLQKIIEYLNTIKRYSNRILIIKFERDEGSF